MTHSKTRSAEQFRVAFSTGLGYESVSMSTITDSMARERIVLETSDKRKAALVETLDLQGETVADWFEEQVTVNFPSSVSALPGGQQQLENPNDLLDTAAVYKRLSKQDWAFSDDDTRYLTHDLHPYPAKFIPQIPAHLIAALSVPGDVVLDPFGGSATTAVEAVRLRRRSISLDANPLSAMIGRVKTGYMHPHVRAELEQLQATVESHNAGKGSSTPTLSKLASKYAAYVPAIPNIDKWFTKTVSDELALLRFLIDQTTEGLAKDAALVALSRIVTRVSNQESETRYVSEAKVVPRGLTLTAYLVSLRAVVRRLESGLSALQYADAQFLTGDTRNAIISAVPACSVDLIVTSPPYPNATDYHLYHRFRLFWLGFDPRLFGHVEIGSHLRHQRNGSGFEEYKTDMREVMRGCFHALQPGRFAVFVVGDAVFEGETFSGADALTELGLEVGFVGPGSIERKIHDTKRSFAKPGRRARAEKLVVLHKPNKPVSVLLTPPRYKMWPYEKKLRVIELKTLTAQAVELKAADKQNTLKLSQPALWNLRRSTFSAEYSIGADGSRHRTWQKILENGDSDLGQRKDPKYATHGIHPYKGKFYPQLAKALLNISNVPQGSKIFDPFCGSGTVLLEGMLNGFVTYGCDINPLAAKIARAKTGIFALPRTTVEHSLRSMLDRSTIYKGRVPGSLDQFPEATHEEILRWFPLPVVHKLNWLLGQCRLFGDGVLVDFLEVIISSLIRDVSHQDPTDLRIRRRKTELEDAPVLELFRSKLDAQLGRLMKYWSVAGRQPGPIFPPTVIQGDSRTPSTLTALGIGVGSIDCVVTSPPYATALPYIDTDRLSLLAVMGIASTERAGLEETLTGSREINRKSRRELELKFLDPSANRELPKAVLKTIRAIHSANQKGNSGFRRENMAALLWRYFIDMRENLVTVHSALRRGGKAFYVVGDSKTSANGDWISTSTCAHVQQIAEQVGLLHTGSIDIDVTTDNHKHIKNAITENVILEFSLQN